MSDKDKFLIKVLRSCKTNEHSRVWFFWAKSLGDSNWETFDYHQWYLEHNEYLDRLREVGLEPKAYTLEPEEMV